MNGGNPLFISLDFLAQCGECIQRLSAVFNGGFKVPLCLLQALGLYRVLFLGTLELLAQTRGLLRTAVGLRLDSGETLSNGGFHGVKARRAGLKVRHAVHRFDDAIFHGIESFLALGDLRIECAEL